MPPYAQEKNKNNLGQRDLVVRRIREAQKIYYTSNGVYASGVNWTSYMRALFTRPNAVEANR